MDTALSAAATGVRKLYNAFKNYKTANSEAQDLAQRLYMLDKMLQQVPKDQELMEEPLQRIARTLDDSYTTVMGRLQTKKGVWRKIKDLATSASARQVFTEIAWEIRTAMSDLHVALSLDSKLDLRHIRELLESRESTLNVNERTLKQILAYVAVGYVNEPVESGTSKRSANAASTTNESDSTSSRSKMTTIAKYAWSDLIWEDGIGPTPQNPQSCLIREGGFGSVYRAKLRGVGDVALKLLDIKPTELRGKRYKEFKRECTLLQRVSTHPNVVSFYGLVSEANAIGLVTDLAEGDSLFSAINEENNDYWAELPTIFKLKALTGIVAAVSYMHSTGVVHADLKPQNILLAVEMTDVASLPTFWVSDFGLAQTTHTVKTSQGSVISPSDDRSTGGTLGFMAPETIDKSIINDKSDMFSLSVLLWSALSCEEPFRRVFDTQQYLHQVKNGNVRPDLNLLPDDTPEGIVHLLENAWDTNPENRPSIEEFLNQWDEMVSKTIIPDSPMKVVNQLEVAAEQGDVVLNAGKGFSTLSDARDYCKQACIIVETLYGGSSKEFARAMDNIGAILLNLGDASGAQPYFEQALAIKEGLYGETDVEQAISLGNLGLVFCDSGYAVDAKNYLKKALSIKMLYYEDAHVEMAKTIRGLGFVAVGLGDYGDAKNKFEQALVTQTRSYGATHMEVAKTSRALGWAILHLGDYRDAKEKFEQALVIQKRYYGKSHIEVANTLRGLGWALSMLQNDDAKDILKQALVIQKAYYGRNHVEVAKTLRRLGGALRGVGDDVAAKQYLETALAIQKGYYGPSHVEIATTLNQLGVVLSALGDGQGAKEYHEQSLAINKGYYGPTHMEVAITLECLGVASHSLGDPKSAKEYYEQCLAIQEECYGPTHVEVAQTLRNLGGALWSLGESQGAMECFEQALPIYKECYGPTHANVALALKDLANTLSVCGDTQRARDCREEAASIE